MKLTRQEDISLYLYVKDRIIAPEYAEYSEEYNLTLVEADKWDIEYEESLSLHPFRRGDYSGKGRGLVYFDIVDDETCNFGIEQSNMVTVYDGPTELTRGVDYSINYLTGQIYSSLDLSSYLVDYTWNYVSVIDSWPYEDVPPLPVVSIELQRGDASPLQLGGGDIRNADWHIEIFATNKGERDDLMDVIYDGLHNKRCPIYVFESGLPLLRDGNFNPSFVVTSHNNFPHLFLENVQKQLTGLPRWGFYENETINKYRASITFESKAYEK